MRSGRKSCWREAVGLDEQVPDEKVCARASVRQDTDADTIRGIGSALQILLIELETRGVGQHVGQEKIEGLGTDGGIVVPPYAGLGRRIADDELVLGRAAGVRAGIDHQGAFG